MGNPTIPRREGSALSTPEMGNSPHIPWAQACGRFLMPLAQASRNRVWWMGRTGRICAAETVGGGIFALRRPRTLQSAFAGRPLRVALRSTCRHCRRLHAHTMPRMESHGFYNRHGTVREGARGWAGNSRPAPTAPPLPRTR